MLYSGLSYTLLLNITEDLLVSDKDIRLCVGGNSMYPHLRKGDYVTISKIPFKDIKKGDIIVFRSASKFIAHRVIKKKHTGSSFVFITKGDSCKKPDSPVNRERYFGRIEAFERKGKIYRFNTPFFRNYNVFLALISPYTPIVYSFVRFFKHLFFKKNISGSDAVNSTYDTPKE